MWAVALVGALAALAALWSSARRHRAGPHGGHWVCAREGLVWFGRDATALFRWEQLSERPGGFVVFRSQPDVTLLPCADACAQLRAVLARWPDSKLPLDDATLAAAREAILQPERRRTLPTFEAPDGPPAAVLAELHRFDPDRLGAEAG